MNGFKSLLLATLSIIALYGCNKVKKVEPQPVPTDGKVTYKMNFVGQLDFFDGAVSKTSTPTRAGFWNGDEHLFIVFLDGDKTIAGEAYYDLYSDTWSVSAFGSLPIGENLSCKLYYFERSFGYSSSLVTCDYQTAIYDDEAATYSFTKNDELTVYGHLKPKTGRVQFRTQDYNNVGVVGLTYYTSFDPNTGKFTTSNQKICLDGYYQDYLYTFFENPDDKRLYVIKDYNAFTRICGADVLNQGKSGFITLPTNDKHNNWSVGLAISVEGVEFTMLSIDPNYTQGYTGIFIGETEVTEELYHKVNWNDGFTSQCPQAYISYNEATDFVNKLSELTPFTFTIPNNTYWNNAAYDGNTFAGSSNLDDIAWLLENSDGVIHEVKQKMPNKKGFYDMNGNVSEFVYDGNLRWKGGSYLTSMYSMYDHTFGDYIYDDYGTPYTDIGIRLCLEVHNY